MYVISRLTPTIISLFAGVAVASPVLAEMTTYTCQINQTDSAGLTIDYDTETGQFALIDYYGAPSLPADIQVSAFDASGPILTFTLNAFADGTLNQSFAYRFDFNTLQALLNSATDGQALATRAGTCVADGQVATFAPPVVLAPPSETAQGQRAVLPLFYGEGFVASVQAALQQSELSIAISVPTPEVPEPQNTICAEDGDFNNPYMEATWCASSQLVSSDFGYGGIQGFITPISNNGSQPAWCTTKGGYGNFGQDQSVELGFWMPLSPPGIEALVIRSGTGNPSDNPYKHSKPRVLRVETEGTTWTWDLQGNTDFQAITFDNPIQSTWVRIVIEEAYLGENWSNTCISDLFAVFEVQ